MFPIIEMDTVIHLNSIKYYREFLKLNKVF